jgi:hypothetical protein
MERKTKMKKNIYIKKKEKENNLLIFLFKYIKEFL